MRTLSNLRNSSRPAKGRKRVGRGPGSGMGKTSCRGVKGAGARSGYKRRLGYEGGQFRLYMKLPQRGFSRARFQKRLDVINLGMVERYFQDGETVNELTLREKGFIDGKCWGVKLLGKGEITKKLAGIEVDAISESAKVKVEAAGISLHVPQ